MSQFVAKLMEANVTWGSVLKIMHQCETVEDLRSESHVRRNEKVRRAIRGGRSRRTLECVAHTK